MTTPDELPPLPEPDGYVAMTPRGSIIVPPQDFAKHNAYAIFSGAQVRAYTDGAVAAARAQLLAELDSLKHDIGNALKAIAEYDSELDALRERAESAERDAQRYRAFFDSGPSVCFMGRDYNNKAECDAAIDAAIKGSAA